MSVILILLGVGALAGLALAFLRLHWVALAVTGLVLAIISANVLQDHGFGFYTEVAIIVACLVVNQFAYLVGVVVITLDHEDSQSPSAGGPPDEPHGEHGQNDIENEHKNDDQRPSRPQRPDQ